MAKKKLASTSVLKTAFDTFSADDLFRNGTFRGKPMSPEEIETIRNNAQAFANSMVWKMLKSELQFFALKTLIEGGKDEQDIRIARAFGNIVQEVDRSLKQWAKGM